VRLLRYFGEAYQPDTQAPSVGAPGLPQGRFRKTVQPPRGAARTRSAPSAGGTSRFRGKLADKPPAPQIGTGTECGPAAVLHHLPGCNSKAVSRSVPGIRWTSAAEPPKRCSRRLTEA
jgi:hypothetical protein